MDKTSSVFFKDSELHVELFLLKGDGRKYDSDLWGGQPNQSVVADRLGFCIL